MEQRSMVQRVRLVAILHGVLTLQVTGVFGLSDGSSDSSLRDRKSYYIFQMLPMRRLKGKPEDAFAGNAADSLGPRTPRVPGAPGGLTPTFQLQPVQVVPAQNPPTPAPRWWGSTALRRPVLRPTSPSRMPGGNGQASTPGTLGGSWGVGVPSTLPPPVLTIPGLPAGGACRESRVPMAPTAKQPPMAPTAKQPRGDV